MSNPEDLQALAQTLLATFENPEVRYVTFERDMGQWKMRRFTRVPENSANPLLPLEPPQ